MKKFSKLFAITLSVLMISAGFASADPKFTPLNFDDSTSVKSSTTSYAATEAKATDMLDPSQVTGGTKMQNSILQIENAQVEIRNKLLNYKNNYAEIDARYNTAKAERSAAKKQIKYAERKIKNLENAKKKIRKNFERKVNI